MEVHTHSYGRKIFDIYERKIPVYLSMLYNTEIRVFLKKGKIKIKLQ